jgi:hypothetical protein
MRSYAAAGTFPAAVILSSDPNTEKVNNLVIHPAGKVDLFYKYGRVTGENPLHFPIGFLNYFIFYDERGWLVGSDGPHET